MSFDVECNHKLGRLIFVSFAGFSMVLSVAEDVVHDFERSIEIVWFSITASAGLLAK